MSLHRESYDEYEYDSDCESESRYTGRSREIQDEEDLHIGHVESASAVENPEINYDYPPGGDAGTTELQGENRDFIKDYVLYPVRGVVQQM
ncbi:hypothetical protein BD410DRAFT_783792 [Rickenella mellea]|uniref:Uncharacterized protein n=1 Tax=Rickenella mellea TaxID=50990 RepID=A0A4Y7QHE8_9AGAM|nr:hypothetical protein BD410DRAFT_783792 [Rickenella mellea]